MSNAELERSVAYSLRWPATLAEQATAEARRRMMSVSAWLREAAREKLERDGQWPVTRN